MEQEWFQTWDRPEYLEWAQKIPEGYMLHILRKESNLWLVARAKLIMGTEGLPGVELIEQCRVSDRKKAYECMESWKQNVCCSSTKNS